MSNKNYITYSQSSKRIHSAKGSCLSNMLIYHAECRLCSKKYVGKTVQRLVERINGHRNKFYECLRGTMNNKNSCEDDYVLGRHLLLCHSLSSNASFDEHYIFTILEHCSPTNIDQNEHK